MKTVDVLIIGGGPAGLAAAVGAYENGARDILILEREDQLGGILNQCIHNGFGLHTFKEELTGPEYAGRYVQKVQSLQIPYKLNTTVLDITKDRRVTAVNSKDGLMQFTAKSIVLCCGCRERPRGAINIAGSRPAGVYSAGTAQKYVNNMGYMVGKRVVILGSGDIGLIMARRMTFEGAKVLAVIELMPYSSGLKRNIVQCLNDFDIPLLLSHTVTEIRGRDRVRGVTACKVDQNLKPIQETAIDFDCDTLLLSVGLLPENELANGAEVPLSNVTGGAIVDETMMTEIDGIFACGNVLHVHDLVDFVSEESEIAGKFAAAYAQKESANRQEAAISTQTGKGVRYIVPQKIHQDAAPGLVLKFRVDKEYRDMFLLVKSGKETLLCRKKRFLAPGEMETLTLDDTLLAAVKQNGDIRLELSEEKA